MSAHRKRIKLEDILALERFTRANLINSFTGFKSANLVGTVNEAGETNLALFSSAVHLGANPPFVGLIQRPVSVPRHTYNNILDTGYFTLNHVHKDWIKAAHQTSAKFEETESEFETCGFTPEYSNLHPAPYVKESLVRAGLEFIEAVPIRVNKTILIVGRIIEIEVPEEILSKDGFLDLEAAGTATISGLDSYHETQQLGRFQYARPGEEVEEIL